MGIKQRSKSLINRKNPLSDTFYQLDVLNGRIATQQPQTTTAIPPFREHIPPHLAHIIYPSGFDVFQVNLGKLCNQSCAHCHVDAGPDRTEIMTQHTMQQCLDVLAQYPFRTVDITGGAPEMNPHFRWFVTTCRALGKQIIVRCNLTILCSNPKYADLPQFFAENHVQVVASLPSFSVTRTDAQRGEGVFNDSIKALLLLNKVGYAAPNSPLQLHLVHNPSGAFLPGNQASLQKEFKDHLKRRYNVHFNDLFVITNMPISRFLEYLLESGNYATYMHKLLEAYNPQTLPGLMCRNTLSISYDGYLYDCDFNQMLQLPVATAPHISQFNAQALAQRTIVFDQHCYGCTAGAGSSCGGEIA